MTAVDDYLRALPDHDWTALRETLADDGLVRIGPYCDEVRGADAYVDYLSHLMPTLENYTLFVDRVTPADARTVFVELRERLDVDGTPTEFPECLVFELDDGGKIEHVRVFIMTPPAPTR